MTYVSNTVLVMKKGFAKEWLIRQIESWNYMLIGQFIVTDTLLHGRMSKEHVHISTNICIYYTYNEKIN